MIDILKGITRPGLSSDAKNPALHSPSGFQNRIILEHWKPGKNGDGPVLAKRVVRHGNIMCTIGLDALNNLLATSSLAFTATNGWIQAGAVGTGVTAPSSNDTALANSTASVHISAASMNISDKGNRTIELQMTFDDGNAYTINEVGLFASNGVTGSCVARSTLAASDQVVKGTADTVNISHQIILTTAT